MKQRPEKRKAKHLQQHSLEERDQKIKADRLKDV